MREDQGGSSMTDGERSIYDVDSQVVALEVMNMSIGQKCKWIS
jgi:hypothetical protein